MKLIKEIDCVINGERIKYSYEYEEETKEERAEKEKGNALFNWIGLYIPALVLVSALFINGIQ